MTGDPPLEDRPRRIEDVASLISAKEISCSLSSLHILVSQIASKVDHIQDVASTLSARAEVMALRVDTLVKEISDHESRMRMLEKWRYALPTSLVLAAASTISAGAAIVITVIR